MRSFVTGGAGFIGSHLVDSLVERGPVSVYDNLSSGRLEFIEHHMERPGFRLFQADVSDVDTLNAAVAGHDVVFHLAANPEARAGIEDTRLDLREGTIATCNVLEAVRLGGIRRVVLVSSGTVYGETPLEPIAEDYGPLLPISLYGASKLASEGLVTAFSHLFGMQAWIFRLANVVGSRATHGVICDLVRKLSADPRELEVLGDGTQEKPYLAVQDCVDGMLFALDHAKQQVNVFNMSSTSTTTVSDVTGMVIAAMGLDGVPIKYRGGPRGWPGDVPQVRLDARRMKELGWEARYTSHQAVARAIQEALREITSQDMV